MLLLYWSRQPISLALTMGTLPADWSSWWVVTEYPPAEAQESLGVNIEPSPASSNIPSMRYQSRLGGQRTSCSRSQQREPWRQRLRALGWSSAELLRFLSGAQCRFLRLGFLRSCQQLTQKSRESSSGFQDVGSPSSGQLHCCLGLPLVSIMAHCEAHRGPQYSQR